ncbi:hypothetical protein ACI2K4_18945 [Micromonospora sp. NPDC050397]|uniref:hypothetical protein n=1 Tax=Micromonospora sp. NPDC050397 TaxID=3364279 RepID=UPI0038516F52
MPRFQRRKRDFTEPRASTRRGSRSLLTDSLLAGGLLAGAAGLIGVAPLATAGTPAGTAMEAIAMAAPADETDGGGSDHSWHDGRDEVKFVPCESGELVGAIAEANANGGGNLRLAPKCTYTLTGYGENQAEGDRTGLPEIWQPIVIEGSGATITRDANAPEFRFFTVRAGGDLHLSDVTLTNGRAGSGGGIRIDHDGTAVVEHATITGNAAVAPDGSGGGIFNDGHLTLTESKLSDNHATGPSGKGGGMLNGGVLAVKWTEFTKNSANEFGGGFANFQGAADLSESTFAHNRAGDGGGIASVAARTKVWTIKVTDNTANTGGGVANKDATITLRDATIDHNTSTVAGGGVSTIQGLLTLDDSTVAANTTGGDGAGIFSERSNLLVRTSESSRNKAVGLHSKGGGLSATGGDVRLFRSKVIENDATEQAGGVFTPDGVVKVDDETVIAGNHPCGGLREEGDDCVA